MSLLPEELEEAKEMVEDCQNRCQRLSKWEEGFIDSIEAQLEEKEFISEKQLSTLERIWEKATKKG